MPKPTSAVDPTPMRVVIVTLDRHLSSAVDRAQKLLRKSLPNLTLTLHAAAEWGDSPAALQRARDDIAQGDIVIATMLFMEDHIKPVLTQLEERRAHCDAMVVGMSAGEVIRLTRMGGFEMGGQQGKLITLLKRLRGGNKETASSGAKQMAMLRRLPKILRLIPGSAQDVRAYFLTLQYWLAASDKNVANMVRFLVNRYASGPRAALRGAVKSAPPKAYPDAGVYHPRMKGRIAEDAAALPVPAGQVRGTVGVLVMRSYVLSGDTGHYDGVIAALEARGLQVIPAFASGLDARGPIDRFFFKNGKPAIDALVSLTGFSLVGGPAYNDSSAAEDILARLDIPYVAAQPVEFQTLDQWQAGDRGLMPIEATMMVAIPELDGATGPIVFGGRGSAAGGGTAMQPHLERVDALASRVDKLIALRKTPVQNRKLAVVLFNFPPNGGSVGTAAHLSVFASLLRTLQSLKADGYTVDVPSSEDELRESLLIGNAARFGAEANVHTRIDVDSHVRQEKWLDEIEAQWGTAPGRQQTDGSSIFVLGAQFGNVFVGVQPAFGYEGDPMRLMFDKGLAPTHAFSAFYRYIRKEFAANAVLHFGTHGALEFMPGKQVGLSSACWPDRLIGDLPNFYLYAANNPSEGIIAKRRSAATLISYLTPSITNAGLYKGLNDLKATIDRWRELPPESSDDERQSLVEVIGLQAATLDLTALDSAAAALEAGEIEALRKTLVEVEETLIPQGLHVLGSAPAAAERADILSSVAQVSHDITLPTEAVDALVDGASAKAAAKAAGLEADEDTLAKLESLADMNGKLLENQELPAVVHALNGGFVRPVSGGDLLRTPDILPTGRNVHGFDPFRLPSAFAVHDGARQANRLIDRHIENGGALPEMVAMVLWGTDNLKSEGAQIAQALALLGAAPRYDSYGRLCGAKLVPLEDLGRARIDVVVTLSGIFRDLLPLQTRMLAEAASLAASADEPANRNFVRKHALAYQAQTGCSIEEASLRIFSNADGAYGSNVNLLIDSGRWDDEDELADAFSKRKCFAYSTSGEPAAKPALLERMLGDVDLTYQNLESVEVGITTVDHYFDTLGGVGRAVQRAKGESVPAYIGDQTQGEGAVRTLTEQVALETRTRALNPAWYESMLKHGYEGVRQIEAQVTNTMGWSATTGQVDPWVYRQLSETFILDADMRQRLSSLNPAASAKVANRLLEAHRRDYWTPDADTIEALQQAGDELEDRLEGVLVDAAA